MTRLNADKRGFTIIELMMATLVFSLILLLLTTGMIQMGRMYYKGLATSKTQDVARNILATVTRDIQFSGGTVDVFGSTHPDTVCIGSRRYQRQLNTEVGGVVHGLVVDSPAVAGACAGNGTMAGEELLGERMQLLALDITRVPASNPASNLFQVTLKVAYGPADLVDASGCKATRPDASQFCAVSQLSTVVQKRI
jgi:prepilin-type N-terminal cleavage/methylation domain-containing protein